MDATEAPPRAKFGLMGFVLGAIALVIVVIQLSAIFSEPEQSAAQSIGEIAAEIKLSAQRALSGESAPPPEEAAQGIAELAALIPYVLAGLAVVFGGVGLYRHEPRQLPYLAIGFGFSAFVMYYAMWMALMICGALILIAIIQNIGDIFSF